MSEKTTEQNLKIPDKTEIIKIVKNLANGNSLPKIGLILRDIHGVGSVKKCFGLKLSKIVKYKMPHDFKNLLAKWVKTHEHIAKNNRDRHGKVRLHNMMSRIKSIVGRNSKKNFEYANFKYDYGYIKKYLYKNKNTYETFGSF